MPRRTKENSLSVYWSKPEEDLLFCTPSGPQTSADGHLLHYRFNSETTDLGGYINLALVEELKRRGYDISTLRFSICKKEDHPRWKM